MTGSPYLHILGKSFTMPELLIDLEPELHPQIEMIERFAAQWARSYLVRTPLTAWQVDHFLASRHAWWIATLYPHGDSERMAALANFCDFFVLYDHLSADTRVEAELDRAQNAPRMLAALSDGGALPADSLLTSMFADTWDRLTTPMSDDQKQRFTRATEGYLASEPEGLRLIADGTVMSFEEYRTFRRVNIGTMPFVAAADYVLGLSLLPELFADPDLIEVQGLVCEHTGLVNDLMSLGKEIVDGHWSLNALGLLHIAEGFSLQESADHVVHTLRDIEHLIAALADKLRGGQWKALPELNAYLTELDLMVAGNVHFHLATPRYRGAGFVWDGVSSGTVTIHADHVDITPLSA
ncbi:hypothetical protein [Nocardia sp. NRRL WC-3656]|uniref:terpene synthase family protein n=1 Tax=Nocardia sp. NRRL WC-3656 TaxID=1463824 RepID=UPI000AD854C0|nr:hypothetical protein [Nocardia sp. NRRL WC-3656]